MHLTQDISIQFTRFSAFYSPLIATIACGYLEEEGLRPKHSVSPPGKSAIEGLIDGSVHVAQSAPSQAISALEQGKTPPALHFAQINEKDGFFLVGRKPEPDFSWQRLKGREVLVDHGGQPTVMFQYACFKSGLDYSAIKALDAGSADKMIAAFKQGTGEYLHLQGPAPQQLEHEGAGHIVAAVGVPIGPCAFSSLAATREWLAGDMAKAFMRAYRKTRDYMNDTPAADIARVQKPYFKDTDERVLAECIATYQRLGCWTRHAEITPAAYEKTLDVYEFNGLLKQRWPYGEVCALPPA